jgi:hypothetical protein
LADISDRHDIELIGWGIEEYFNWKPIKIQSGKIKRFVDWMIFSQSLSGKNRQGTTLTEYREDFQLPLKNSTKVIPRPGSLC